jgi:putative endonuclease
VASYFVYILSNRRDGTLYVGVTNDLVRRVYEHRDGLVRGFTRRYGVKRLVYFEIYDDRAARYNARKISSTGAEPGRSL